MKDIKEVLSATLILAFILVATASWVTNLMWTFAQTGMPVVLGVAGVFFFPLGMAHGIYLWLA